uniref:Lipocalin/cytosolic fatty-acid binding domain-containing protein n=1 Tax=Heliothis virescens TaxID=7102 RepID=A0A2A4JTG0_HELVI
MMAKLIILVVNLFCIFSASVAVIQTGQCNENIQVVTGFNLDDFGGTWYDLASYANTHQSGTCNTATYTINNDRTISVLNSQVVNQGLATASGSATIENESIGKLLVMVGGSTVPIPYWVLSTDYNGYALIYACRNVNQQQREVFSWKLSRVRTGFADQATTAMNTIINNLAELSQDQYVTRDHSANGCFYYPVFDTPVSEIVLPGSCEAITGVSNFNAQAYLGTWYEIARYPQPTQQGQCNSATYANAANGAVSVLNSQVLNEALASISGSAVVSSTDNTGKLTVTFVVAGEVRNQDLYVLATDYLNYALVYACTNLANGDRVVGSWKLSRTKSLSANALTVMDSVIANTQALHEQYYQQTLQTDAACFYYPVFDGTETTIDLPGSCATAAVAGVPNFNLASYAGLWYEVARYPQPTQQGQCNRANYESTANGVSVQNSQVINEALASITGEARVISTDNSGVLEVTLNVGGVPTSTTLYVLATDYNSYSVVYTCTDLPNGDRRVGSWKLSRRREGLNANDITAVNTIVANTQGLKEDYYRPTSQSDASCFYYPVFESLPATIDLPGACETATVTGIPNFNINAYAGLWYEVARYPQPTQQGQCNRAQYGVQGAGLTVTNQQVINQALASISGQATLASTDNSGRLQVTFNIGGVPTSTDLYILATDYTSYSLVYTCENLADGNRRVGSWKLSRTPQLTQQAVNDIALVVANTQGLNENYYQATSQSDASCFYYPAELIENEVRLPGQCDTSIRGVASFDINAFARTWYHIQRYDSVQGTTCSGTKFSLNSDNTLDVVNFEVADGELVTVEGTGRVSSTDGTGQITLSASGNETSDTVLYILATDYTGYAVAHSCENIEGENWRRVRSWQLSAERTLPAAATPIISALITETQELHLPYFNAVSHNDDCLEPSSAMLFKSSIIVIFICTVLQALCASRAIQQPGQCEQNIAVVQNFNVQAYSGIWYDIASYASPFQNGTCHTAQYTVNNDGTVTVLNSQVVNQTLQTVTGTATLASTDNSAKLRVTIGGAPPSDYWVLTTDYTSYALVYSCRNVNANTREILSWKLSRSKVLTPAAEAAINNVIMTVSALNQQHYVLRDHSADACHYYDSHSNGIELPGACETVRAVPNFNAVAYLGTWYEIARYPIPTQQGQCDRATYEDAGNGVVSVLNSQVVNQTLDTISGEARLASTDGSGKLQVTFVFGGVPSNTDLYVLATDYVTYSLVYSCTNLPNGNRRVGSWKLSRSTVLSQQAINVMNTVIANTPGLREEYYQPTSQSAEACFYYPDGLTDGEVRLPGQCNETITGVTAFTLSAFARTWYHIQRYDSVEGKSCSGTRLVLNAGTGTVNVTDFEVVNGELVTSEGTGRLNSNDNTGRILLNIPGANGNGSELVVYILATDYNDYAVAYSCENVNASERRVRAWLLSSERTMSTTGVTAIIALAQTRPELNPRYFNQVPQNSRCPEPSSAFTFKSSIILLFVCAVLQMVR